MKKGILILVGMFMMVSTVEAKTGDKSPNRIRVGYNYNDAVSFVEKGIKFHVFLNGDFDFNSRRRSTYYDYNGIRTKRRGIRIERDFHGRIYRVGNVFINYDHRGNVKRIGNVFMRYRRGNLTRVGNLRIKYNKWGEPRFYGHVRNNDFYDDRFYHNDVGFNIDVNFGDVCDYNDPYFYRNDFRTNYYQIREDNNFFYYKARPNARIGKRSTILKRRKPVKRAVTTNKKYKKRNEISEQATPRRKRR